MVTRSVGAAVADAGAEPAGTGWKLRKISMAGGCLSSRPSMEFLGRVKVRITLSPCCVAARSLMAVGIGGLRSVGSPGAPQPARRGREAKRKKRKWKRGGGTREVGAN